MHLLLEIIFIAILAFAICFFAKNAKKISRNIQLGRKEEINDHKDLRWKNVLLLAFGQKKMFKTSCRRFTFSSICRFHHHQY